MKLCFSRSIEVQHHCKHFVINTIYFVNKNIFFRNWGPIESTTIKIGTRIKDTNIKYYVEIYGCHVIRRSHVTTSYMSSDFHIRKYDGNVVSKAPIIQYIIVGKILNNAEKKSKSCISENQPFSRYKGFKLAFSCHFGSFLAICDHFYKTHK